MPPFIIFTVLDLSFSACVHINNTFVHLLDNSFQQVLNDEDDSGINNC